MDPFYLKLNLTFAVCLGAAKLLKPISPRWSEFIYSASLFGGWASLMFTIWSGQ